MQTGCRRDETCDVLCPVELMLDAADEIDRLRDALFWCGGSPSFAPGGEAHEGWEKMVEPLMRLGV
jgi:hypothetical protein